MCFIVLSCFMKRCITYWGAIALVPPVPPPLHEVILISQATS